MKRKQPIMSLPSRPEQPAKRLKRKPAQAYDFSALEFACLFRGPHDSDEIVRMICVSSCIADWKIADWGYPNRDMSVSFREMRVETVQPAVDNGTQVEQPTMTDNSSRPGRCSTSASVNLVVPANPLVGRLAPRWLHDLYMGMLADRPSDTGDIFTHCANLPDRLSLTRASASPANGHELLSIDIQCPEPTTKSQLISCICRHCKYHLLFHFEHDTPENNISATCPPPNPCHLVLAESNLTVPLAEDAFNPVTNTGTWRCSSTTCSFRVTVSVSKPRMKKDHILLIVDDKRIASQRQAAIELDPVRFNPESLKSDLELTPLMTLNAYLRDCLQKTPDDQPRKIATRNKRFYIQFGPACSHIFEYLGLVKREIDDEEYWFLPELQHYPNEKTPINTQRAFIEDARSEIQALIEELGGQQSGGTVKPWSEALFKLKRALNCTWWDTAGGKKPENDDADLQTLGTLPNQNEDLLKYAYQRQVETDPANQRKYCSALQGLASNRSVDLQIFTATEASLIEQNEISSQTPLAQAYTYFNLQPNCTEADDFVIRQYKVFGEQSPAQKVDHRKKLFLIGRERKSKLIMEQAAADFGFEEACDYLQLDASVKAGNVPDVVLLEYYVSQAVEVSTSVQLLWHYRVSFFSSPLQVNIANTVRPQGGDTRYMCSKALQAIAMRFDSVPIMAFANSTRQKGYKDEGSEFASLFGAQDDDAVASNEIEQADLTLPPGLDNLRNTCYLNSILQYFYTVTPVREIVLNFDPKAAGLSIDLANQNEEVYLGRECRYPFRKR